MYYHMCIIWSNMYYHIALYGVKHMQCIFITCALYGVTLFLRILYFAGDKSERI